jgi:hypothetical protein
MERAHNIVKRAAGDAADSWIPLNDNRSAYTKMNMSPDMMSSAQKKNARTDQSIWSLVNGVTHCATHAPQNLAFNMTDRETTEMMVQAGNILGKGWDLGNQMPSPFADNAHLETSNQVGALLN